MDAHKNFATGLIATAPSPALSGTSLIVAADQGARFPTPPFNATLWPNGLSPTSANAEIVRVTDIISDTLAITRAQEGTTAKTVLIGWKIAATVTAKTLTDIEASKTQSGAGSPVGVKTPAFIGQLCVDTTSPYGLWFASGLTSDDWQQLLGS